MSKRRIHINESQIHRLIEQSINEISTQTKMGAANKASREAEKYWERYNNPDPDDPYSRNAFKMWDKRSNQKNAFRDAVNKDMDDLAFVSNTSFSPAISYNDEIGFNQRGGMHTHTKPIEFSSYGKLVYPSEFPDAERDKRFKDVEQFLNGNSYYERGSGWVNPDDEGYDKEKSEPWAKIRKKNEAIARRVTESVKRRLLKEWESDRWYRSVEDDIIDQIEESSLDNESPLPKEDEADVEGFIDSKRRAEGHAEWTIEEDGTVSDVYINLEIAGSRKSSYAETYECDMEYIVQKLAQKGITVVL